MEKLLVQTRASENDPKFAAQEIDGVPFAEFFRSSGIRILKEELNELVRSCHGNPESCRRTAKQIQILQNQGHNIVVMETGGLYFGRPSMDAAIAVTVPILSVPLGGLDAFLAPRVPGGKPEMAWSAAIGGVGLKQYGTAAYVAREILLKEFPGVYLWGTQPSLVGAMLDELKIPVLGSVNVAKPEKVDGILIGDVSLADLATFDAIATIGVYASAADPNALMRASAELRHSVYAGRPENTAIFAGRAMAAYRKDTREALRAGQRAKAATYDESITLSLDSFE